MFAISTTVSPKTKVFATRVSCGIRAKRAFYVKVRASSVGAGHDANRPFTRLPCLAEYLE
jgi:hypothetical protein